MVISAISSAMSYPPYAASRAAETPAPSAGFHGLPLPNPSTSRPQPRETAEPHTSSSRRVVIAGKRPLFQGMQIGIRTVSEGSPDAGLK